MQHRQGAHVVVIPTHVAIKYDFDLSRGVFTQAWNQG